MPTRKKLPTKPKPTPGTYWHGGAPGLGVGDLLIPASEQAQPPGWYDMSDYDIADATRVYITDLRPAAESFAAQYVDWSTTPPTGPGGALYKVTPLGDLEADPDYSNSPNFFTCQRARIDEVVRPRIRQVDQATHMAVLRWATWEDGAPVYDANGRALPPPVARKLGITAHHLTFLGFAASVDVIKLACTEMLLDQGITPQALAAYRHENP